MIRLPESTDELTVSLELLDGTQYLDRDVTDNPFGDNGDVVSFWDGEKTVLVYPMSQIKWYMLTF